jgi:hypothetical protein
MQEVSRVEPLIKILRHLDERNYVLGIVLAGLDYEGGQPVQPVVLCYYSVRLDNLIANGIKVAKTFA